MRFRLLYAGIASFLSMCVALSEFGFIFLVGLLEATRGPAFATLIYWVFEAASTVVALGLVAVTYYGWLLIGKRYKNTWMPAGVGIVVAGVVLSQLLQLYNLGSTPLSPQTAGQNLVNAATLAVVSAVNLAFAAVVVKTKKTKAYLAYAAFITLSSIATAAIVVSMLAPFGLLGRLLALGGFAGMVATMIAATLAEVAIFYTEDKIWHGPTRPAP